MALSAKTMRARADRSRSSRARRGISGSIAAAARVSTTKFASSTDALRIASSVEVAPGCRRR